MKQIKVAVGYIIALAVTEKILFMAKTVTYMTNNPVYANPLIALNIMTQLINNLQTAWDSQDKTAIKIAVAALNKAIRRQSLFIDVVSDGDETIITTAGFPTTSAVSAPAVPLTKPAAPILTHGAPGSIKKNGTALKGAKHYLNIICTNPAMAIDTSGEFIIITIGTDKIIIDSTTSHFSTITGLQSQSIAYVKTIGYNKLGKSPDSDTVNIVVP